MSNVLASGRRRPAARGWLALAVALSLSVITFDFARAEGRPRPVRVMTRNLYLGADLAPIVLARNLPEVAIAASSIWRQALATDFPERAAALAAEIEEADPVLIGLQEVALWRGGAPDGPPGFGGTPAENVEFDFLQTLRDELEARGFEYDIVAVQQQADFEAPTVLGFDIRLTLRDAILARAGLPPDELSLSSPRSGNFANHLTLPIAGGFGSFSVTRGWNSVDVTSNRRTFRLVNTHLEAFANFFRTAQTFELLAGPLVTTMPVVLVGDLNSDPDDPVFSEPGSPFNSTNPYDLLIGSGFTDSWVVANGSDGGFTCCNAADLLNSDSTYDVRIDHILTRPGVATYRSKRVGDDADQRTPSGLWPSDHAGVVAALAP